MKKPAMYIFVNRELGMSPGKMAAQVAHAAVEAYRGSPFPAIDAWYVGGHYAKYVMEARDFAHISSTETYLRNRGFKVFPIIDEGHTEVPAISYTALGVEIVDKADPHVQASFEAFKTYKEKPGVFPLATPEPVRSTGWWRKNR